MSASDLDLLGMRVFHAIVEAGSFSGAADRLGMAPPMVSKHMARLERALGSRLLHRTSRSMSLTEAGTTFYELGRQAMELLDVAVTSVDRGQVAPRGELRISAPAWCATPRFAALLVEYRRTFPEVRLDLHLNNHLVDIVAEGFDMALRTTAEPAPQLIARPLCQITFPLVATPAFLATQDAEAAETSRAMPIVTPNYHPYEHFKSALEESLRQRIDPVMKSSDSTLSYQMVLAGMGAAVLPSWLVADDLACGRLVRLPSGPDFTGTLFAVYASRRHMPLKLRSFIDFLVAHLAQGPVAR